MAAVVNVTDATFDSEVNTTGVVLVDFWKDGCQPCERIANSISELVERFPNVKFVKANIKDAPKAAARLGVNTFPMVFVFRDGQRKTYFGGWMPTEVIAGMLRDVL